MATVAQWLSGARPRTLPAALAPVLVGTGAAVGLGARHPGRAATALVVALALQIGVNYANDYSDGVRGTDDERVGPFRLTGSRAARPEHVRNAAFASFGAAAVAGVGLVAVSGTWWLIGVGATAILAAWYYTGGHRPYGYRGLGELFVFVFFGLVAVLGTTYTQALTVSVPAVAAAVAVGALACALLVVNNLRDVTSDEAAGKLTLAVRIGAPATRRLYGGLIALALLAAAAVAPWRPWSVLALAAALAAMPPLRAMAAGATGRDLLPVLRDTGRLELVYAILLGIGLAV